MKEIGRSCTGSIGGPSHRHAPEPEDEPDGDDQSAEQDREVTRTHARGGAEGKIGTEAEPGETDEHEHQARPEILRTLPPATCGFLPGPRHEFMLATETLVRTPLPT